MNYKDLLQLARMTSSGSSGGTTWVQQEAQEAIYLFVTAFPTCIGTLKDPTSPSIQIMSSSSASRYTK